MEESDTDDDLLREADMDRLNEAPGSPGMRVCP